MPNCVFNRATAIFVSGARYDSVPFDPGTQIHLLLPDMPDPVFHRWDGDIGIRPATQEEIDELQHKKGESNRISITDFGAVADSTTDNIAAFNEALDAAGPGDKVCIPSGKSGYYRISSNWRIDKKPGVIIEGEGDRSMIVVDEGNAISLLDSPNYRLRDFCISGKVGSGHGIKVGESGNPSSKPSHYGTIEDVFIRGVDGNAIDIQSAILTKISRPMITTNKALPFPVVGGGTTKRGINVAFNLSGINNSPTIIAPIIEGMGTHGIYVDSIEGLTVVGGTVEGNGNRTIGLGNVDHANFYLNAAQKFVIVNVYCEQNNDVERNYILNNCYSGQILGGMAGSDTAIRGQVELLGVTERVNIIGVYGNQFTLGPQTIGNRIEYCTYNNAGGAITNLASGLNRNIIQNNYKGNGGILESFVQVPMVTTATRDTITNVTDVVLLFNNSIGKLQFWSNGKWETISSS